MAGSTKRPARLELRLAEGADLDNVAAAIRSHLNGYALEQGDDWELLSISFDPPGPDLILALQCLASGLTFAGLGDGQKARQQAERVFSLVGKPS